ncbi:hypothetical protein BHU72_10385 [Desulfuribacillus stibiiarsenatis]|uniref:Diguanylate cyclase n=1 Tax=Desulfuribacillus stibiiarsenatis TaxID=1390249 RepID=A0A1E5L9I4_9FIRM|nr:bifunctional diguanylate cyclase/phosphodiesterase [Desulfuribacillus stibiiarsenatis]OEH86649.1 hypothetical protein BHU72_10385 [Desulfuribacillus stibiiarsenatis]
MLELMKKAFQPIVAEPYTNRNSTVGIVKKHLERKEYIHIIYLDLIQFEQVEQSYGEQYAYEFLNSFTGIINREIKKLLPDTSKLISTHNLWGDDFILLIATKNRIPEEELCKVRTSLDANITQVFSSNLPSYFKDYKGIHVGYTTISPPAKHVEKQFYKALKEAYKIAKRECYNPPQKIMEEFHHILKNKTLESVFQPILSLDSGENYGWEALTRGPQSSFFHSPNDLFPFAERVNSLFALETASRELSIQKIGWMKPNQKLFINVDPSVIKDSQFHQGVTRTMLKKYNLSPQQIVFELTERTAIQNFKTFRKTIEHYRSQGYLIAVDDAGAGYSSLQTIAEIKPDFIKLDMSIIRGIDKDPVKKALLETFVTFSQKINCQLIAEGIETDRELAVVTKLGVHLGQGYYIGKPTFPKELPSKLCIQAIQGLAKRPKVAQWYDRGMVARDLVSYVPAIQEGSIIEEVAELFENQSELQGIVVLDKDSKPSGFLLRQNLYKTLIARYGVALYYRKPIEEIMDTRPLSVQAETPIELVANLAMKRDAQRLYDFIIVMDRDNYLGIITVQNLLESLTQLKIEQARYANPLTGLAGNIIIEKEIEQCIILKQNHRVILYIDVDFFKAYNDTYGFEQGDRFLLLISRILKHVMKGEDNIFIGHVGGDDFVIICPFHKAEKYSKRIIRIYQRLLRYYYNLQEWECQAIIATDRLGRSCVYPLSSLSIAGVLLNRRFADVISVGERAAFLKKEVKKICGNAYLIEGQNISY